MLKGEHKTVSSQTFYTILIKQYFSLLNKFWYFSLRSGYKAFYFRGLYFQNDKLDIKQQVFHCLQGKHNDNLWRKNNFANFTNIFCLFKHRHRWFSPASIHSSFPSILPSSWFILFLWGSIFPLYLILPSTQHYSLKPLLRPDLCFPLLIHLYYLL